MAMFPAIDIGRHQPPKPVEDAAFWDEPHGSLRAYLTPDAGLSMTPPLPRTISWPLPRRTERHFASALK